MRRRLRWIAGGLVLVVLLMCAGIPGVLWTFGGGSPVIAVDYMERLNARAAAIPEGDRAWGVYLPIVADAERMSEAMQAYDLSAIGPGDPGWADAERMLDDNASVLETIRKGAAMPGLGFIASQESDRELRLARGEEVDPTETSPEPDWVLMALYGHLGELRRFAKLLEADARVAAAARDAPRFVSDARALLGLSAQANEHGTLIGDLVQIAIRALAFEVIGEGVRENPAIFDDAALADLASGIDALDGGGVLTLRTDGERLYFDDTVQRMFTDDGDGNGRITGAGIAALRSLEWSGEGRIEPTHGDRLRAGLMRAFSSTRAEVIARHRAFFDAFERAGEQPMWARDRATLLSIEQEIEDASNPVDAGMYMLSMLIPAVGRAQSAADRINATEDALRVGIALERARRASGIWPASLDELVPEFLAAVPPDPFTGEPLRFLIEDGKPVVYSVGTDRNDDGGRHAPEAHEWRDPESAARLELEDPVAFDGDWLLYPKHD